MKLSERRYWLWGIVVLAVVALLGGVFWWQATHVTIGGPGGSAQGGSAQLLTYNGSCFVGPAAGRLVADPKSGTAIWFDSRSANESQDLRNKGAASSPVPVAWPPGFSGRYAGGEIEVLAPDGRVVAVTGRRVVLMGGGGTGAFWACGVEPEQ